MRWIAETRIETWFKTLFSPAAGSRLFVVAPPPFAACPRHRSNPSRTPEESGFKRRSVGG